MLAPVLLVAVAVLQLSLSHVHGLSPWKGGGFGMFASVDRAEHRVLLASFVGEDEVRPIDVASVARSSQRDGRLVQRTTTMPSPGALARLEERLRELEWVTAEGRLLHPEGARRDVDVAQSPTLRADPERFPHLVVEVRTVSYESGGRVTTRTVERLTVAAEP